MRRAAKGIAMLGASVATAMTLMACYGVPYEPECTDVDGDGYCPPADCDDSDFERRPGAVDTAGDGIDQNCDGVDGMMSVMDSGTDSGSDAGM